MLLNVLESMIAVGKQFNQSRLLLRLTPKIKEVVTMVVTFKN
jgi:hypothetical protein